MPTRPNYFSSEAVQADLKGKTVRGGLWTGGAQGLALAVSLGSQLVLARLMGPADFGLVAMVAVFTNFAAMFVDAGLSMATVQKGDISHRQVSNLFWIASALGVVIALVVAALSPLISLLYSEPRLVPITLALCLSYVLSGLTVQHQALLRRGMQFKELALVSVLSQAAGAIAGIVWGVWRVDQPDVYWGLVLIPLVTAAARLVLTWVCCPWRPGLPQRGVGTRDLVVFGANLTGFNFVNYFSRNADKLLIGWWWGDVPLGLYERSYKLFLFPLQSISTPISSVMVPALSRLADTPDRLRAAYLRAIRPLLYLVTPAVAAVAVNADWWIVSLLGEQWSNAAPILQCLAVLGMVQPLTGSTSWLFVSQGRTQEMLQGGLIASLTTVASFFVGLPWGPIGVATSYAISGLLIRIPFWLYFMERRDIMPARLMMGELASVTPVAAAVIAVNLALRFGPLPIESEWVGLLLSLTASVAAWLIITATTRHGRGVYRELLGAVSQALPKRSASGAT